MSQFGAGQNVPYSGQQQQQEADLVNNPRYTGKSTGTNPLGHHDRLGHAEVSRYGAAPVNTAGGDGCGNPRREGVVDKSKDAVGMGPHSGTHPHGAGGDVNYPNEGRGFGAGRAGGTTTGYDQHGVGTGMGIGHHIDDRPRVVPGTIPQADLGERRVEPGYDASKGQIGHAHHGTLTGSPRKEGIVEKIKDAVGMGKHDKASHAYPGTTMGTMLPNTHGTGDPGFVHHTNPTPGYTHNSMVDTGLGHGRHPGSSTGYPHERVDGADFGVGHGEHGLHNTASAYPGSTEGYPHNTAGYPHETMGDRAKDAVGMGPHHGEHPHNTTGYPHETMGDRAKDAVGMGPHQGGTGEDSDYERRGKGFEDTSGVMHDGRTEPGFDATRTGTGTGYGDTNRVDYPQNDATAYGIDSGTAPPKKGIMSKVKEKLHR